MNKIDEIKQALAAAESAVWETRHFEDGMPYMSIMGKDCVTVAENAPEWLAYLVGEVERLKGANEELFQNREKWRESHMFLEQENERLREALEEISDYAGSALTGVDAIEMKMLAREALKGTE